MDRIKELISNNKYIRECDNLPSLIKVKIWIHYLCRYAKTKLYSNLYIEKNGEYKITYPFSNSQPIDFDNFCKNIKYINVGPNWKVQGFAQEDWIDYPIGSIYYWYSKIK